MQKTGNNYLSWHGTIYNSDIVRACITPKVKAVGKLVPKHIRETTDADGNKDIVVNPSPAIRMLLERPNPLMSGMQFREKMATQLCINSNAFALIQRDPMGNAIAMYPIAPTSAQAIYSDSGELSLRFTMPNGKLITASYSDIIHLRQNYNENDIFGTPIAPVLTPLLDVVTTTDQGVINAIKNSSVIRWLLKFTNAMRPEDLKKNAKDFADSFLATSEGTGVAAVDAKADATQISPSDFVPNAAQMDRTTQRIYALFNTNEHIVTSSYTEDEYGAYFDAEIEPVEIDLATELTYKLFSAREIAFGNRIVLEAEAWDSASTKTKLSLVSMVDRGGLTVNEWRAAFNLSPLPGGDTPIRRLDTQPTDGAGDDADKNSEEGGSAD